MFCYVASVLLKWQPFLPGEEKEKLKQKYEARRNFPWNDKKLQIVSMLLTSLFPSSDKEEGETTPFLMTQNNLPQGKLLQKQMKALHMY